MISLGKLSSSALFLHNRTVFAYYYFFIIIIIILVVVVVVVVAAAAVAAAAAVSDFMMTVDVCLLALVITAELPDVFFLLLFV